MNNKSDIITGSIHTYLVSTIAYYSLVVFAYEKYICTSFGLSFLHITIGAIAVYVINYYMHNNLKREAKILINAGCFILYAFAAQFFIYKNIQIYISCLCIALYAFAVYLNYKKTRRMPGVMIFELSAAVLLFAAFIIDVKFDADINVIPIVVSVILGLVEVSRLTAADKSEKKQIMLLDFSAYFVCVCSAFAVVLLKKWIILLIDGSINGIKHAAYVVAEAIKRFFLSIYILLDFSNAECREFENSQDYGKVSTNVWILIALGIILMVALVIGVIALVKKKWEKRRTTDGDKVKTLDRKRRNYQAEFITKREADKRIKREKQTRKKSKIIWLLKGPDNPQLFMYKLNRLFRKTDYCIEKHETPRQYINKILKQEFVTEETRNDLKTIIDDIDIYYYSDRKNMNGYKKKSGKKLLKELRKCMKRQRKLKFVR